MRVAFFVLFSLTWLVPCSANATSILRVTPSTLAVSPGGLFAMEIRADLPADTIGFGLDMSFNPAVITLIAPPAIGPLWVAVGTVDGDGLAGVSFSGVSGSNVLIATLLFQALGGGQTALSLGRTPGDVTEGIALGAGGFDALSFESALITVPEPGTALLVGVALILIVRVPRRA